MERTFQGLQQCIERAMGLLDQLSGGLTGNTGSFSPIQNSLMNLLSNRNTGGNAVSARLPGWAAMRWAAVRPGMALRRRTRAVSRPC
jgi:hypothetical protein